MTKLIEVVIQALPFLFTGAMTLWHGRNMYALGKSAGRREVEVELLCHRLVIEDRYRPGTGVMIGADALPGKKKPNSTAN